MSGDLIRSFFLWIITGILVVVMIIGSVVVTILFLVIEQFGRLCDWIDKLRQAGESKND